MRGASFDAQWDTYIDNLPKLGAGQPDTSPYPPCASNIDAKVILKGHCRRYPNWVSAGSARQGSASLAEAVRRMNGGNPHLGTVTMTRQAGARGMSFVFTP